MQNEERAAELGEKSKELNSDAQELADLVKTKEQVIADLKQNLWSRQKPAFHHCRR